MVMIMEYYEGGELRDLLLEKERLTELETRNYFK
jgi:serine/threonine protein kinase